MNDLSLVNASIRPSGESYREGLLNHKDKPSNTAEEEARVFLKIIEDASSYMFGYNHSTGYSMIGLCAYLRYYYPQEFITAYLNNANNEDDIKIGTKLAKQLGITVHSIKFRHSTAKYSCDENGIYKGIASVKFLNEEAQRERCKSFLYVCYPFSFKR